MSDWLTPIIALSGVISSAILAYLAYSLNRQGQRAQIQTEIASSYDRLIAFRSDHTDVLRLSRLWNEACFGAIYAQASAEDRQWALYYTYAELCFSFCNAVLSGWQSRLIDPKVYQGYYRPLVKLLLTEHHPLVATLLEEGKFISLYIKDFRRELENEGWNWAEMHSALTGAGPEERIAERRQRKR